MIYVIPFTRVRCTKLNIIESMTFQLLFYDLIPIQFLGFKSETLKHKPIVLQLIQFEYQICWTHFSFPHHYHIGNDWWIQNCVKKSKIIHYSTLYHFKLKPVSFVLRQAIDWRTLYAVVNSSWIPPTQAPLSNSKVWSNW